MAVSKLFGTWRLLTIEFVTSDTGERTEMYGADPLGFITITPDQRMMAIISVREPRERDDAALFKQMMAYTGPVRIEGDDQFITTVEAAWHPGWVGTEQARFFTIADDILSIISAEVSHPNYPGRKGRGIVRWERVSSF